MCFLLSRYRTHFICLHLIIKSVKERPLRHFRKKTHEDVHKQNMAFVLDKLVHLATKQIGK